MEDQVGFESELDAGHAEMMSSVTLKLNNAKGVNEIWKIKCDASRESEARFQGLLSKYGYGR